MKRSLWFDASMLVLILIVSTVASALEREPNDRPAASSQTVSSAEGVQRSLR